VVSHPLRGAIYWLDLGEPKGSVPALQRPTLIISDDRYNASALRTVTVAALTSNMKRASQPGNVAVPAELSGLDRDSVVNVTQLITVDRSELSDACGMLPTELMAQVDAGLRRALSL
jgi:mRNA interferase MazF